MDYSKFVTAVLQNDRALLDELSMVISKVLIKFLLVRMDASLEDAKDSAHNTILFTIEKIKNDSLNHPDRVINYLFTTAKNDYLKSQNKNREDSYDEVPDHYSKEGDQLQNILDEEKAKNFEGMLEKLKAKQFEYIDFWFKNPRIDASQVASHFKMSVNNAWTKKHRILQVLKECVQKNINK